MSQDNQNGKKPAFTAFIIPERDGAPWIPVGAAWPHKDGEGYSIRLDLMPTPGTRIVLRKPDAGTSTDAGTDA
jgi:hypothetical protein